MLKVLTTSLERGDSSLMPFTLDDPKKSMCVFVAYMFIIISDQLEDKQN